MLSGREMVNYGFDVTDVTNEKRVCAKDIACLEAWAKAEKNTFVSNLNQQQIVIFLIACDGNIDAVKKCLFGYVQTRLSLPEIFENRSTLNEDIIMQLETVKFCLIPKRTANNDAIVINKVVESTPSRYHMDIAMKYLFMIYDSLLYERPPDGVIVLFDMDNTSVRHITRTKISLLKALSAYVQNSMPLKIKEIHIMNALWFLPKFLNVLKPFMQKELMGKVHVHLKDQLAEFYANSVPETHLPSDYGGMLGSVEELHEDTYCRLTSLNEHFAQDELERRAYAQN